MKAADFIARGVEKGPALGAALAAAEEAWIAAGFPADAAALDAIAIAASSHRRTSRRNEKPGREARGFECGGRLDDSRQNL